MFRQSTSHSRHWLLIVILTMMSMVGLVGSDVYLPALPMIGQAFNQSMEALQYTLGIYLIGLALGQLFFGPLSDRLGRKNLIMIGMFVYALASIACALSESYVHMMAARFLQALGASSGLVIGRAMVADLFEKNEAGKVFATIFPFVGMSPAISPAIGGFISYYWGWQACFIFIALFAFAIIVLALPFLPESLPPDKRRALSLRDILLAYPALLADKQFVAYALAPCLAYLAYFAYIAQSPFIFNARGYGEREMGLLYMTLSITYVSGNILARKFLNTIPLNRVLYFGYVIFGLGGILFYGASLLDAHIFFIIAAMSLLTFGNGFLIPLGFAGSLSAATSQTGNASGLLGFLQLSCAALATTLVGKFTQNSVVILGGGLFLITAIGFASFATLVGLRRSE